MRKRASLLIFSILFMVVLASTASADIGPKPSVVIEFKTLSLNNCYVTLLSQDESTGPFSVYNGDHPARYTEEDAERAIWEKFVSYKDAEGFYFLQYFQKLDSAATFKWGYHPPATFKILMYFPDYDRFVVSDTIYARYAFDSYYRVDASALTPQSIENGVTVSATKNYHFIWEALSLLIRIVLTIILELALALLFGFKAKKQIRIIIITNLVTQTILNILLNMVNYSHGQLMFTLSYFLFELLVFAIEAVVFGNMLNKYAEDPMKKGHPILYAFVANLLSFGVGFGLAYIIPGIF